MRPIIISSLMLLCAALWAFPPPGGSGGWYLRSNLKFTSTGDPCSSCTNETYEGTGYSVAGWTETLNGTGIVNEDYSTAPAPLDGSQSLVIRNPSGDSAFDQLTVPSSTEAWIRFKFVMTNTVVNGLRIMYMADNVFAMQAEVRTLSGKLQIVAGTATASTANSISADTVYYCRMHYKQVTGANNDLADIEFSTTKQFTGSGGGFASVSTGSGNNPIVTVGPGVFDWNFAGVVGGVIYDQWSFTNLGQPGDFP